MSPANGSDGTASRARSAAFQASRASLSGRSHANSSPPMRATRSSGRERRSSRSAISRSTSSPTWWPWRSFTSLKWSRSISASASGRRCRRARSTSSRSRSWKARWFARPVSGSLAARCSASARVTRVRAWRRALASARSAMLMRLRTAARSRALKRRVLRKPMNSAAQDALADGGVLEPRGDERAQPRDPPEAHLRGGLQLLAHHDPVGRGEDRVERLPRVRAARLRLEHAAQHRVLLRGVERRVARAVGQHDHGRPVRAERPLGRRGDRVEGGGHVEAARRDRRGRVLHRAPPRLGGGHRDAGDLGQAAQAARPSPGAPVDPAPPATTRTPHTSPPRAIGAVTTSPPRRDPLAGRPPPPARPRATTPPPPSGARRRAAPRWPTGSPSSCAASWHTSARTPRPARRPTRRGSPPAAGRACSAAYSAMRRRCSASLIARRTRSAKSSSARSASVPTGASALTMVRLPQGRPSTTIGAARPSR